MSFNSYFAGGPTPKFNAYHIWKAHQVVAKEGDYVTLRLASTEMRMVHGNCMATIGEVGNSEHELLSHGKAGKSRWLGKRPKVRGEVMNPVDHPNGGRTKGGKHWATPWGKPTKGHKTRKNKTTDKYIVRSRTGKYTRQLRSPWTDAWQQPEAPEPLPMPRQNILVSEAHQRMNESGDPGTVAMPVGQIVGRMNEVRPVAEVMASLVSEFEDTVKRLDSIT